MEKTLIKADEALQALRMVEPVFSRLMDRIGPYKLETYPEHSPFQALVRAILAQQVSKHAANTIRERLYALLGGGQAPTAEDVAAADISLLRSAGISGRKAETIQRLAVAQIEGRLPDRRALVQMEDQAVRDTLIAFKGVGPWTANMLLIFYLGRPDIFPPADLGVRRGYKIAFGLDTLPTVEALRARAEAWRPWRTVAAWYLWRANDL